MRLVILVFVGGGALPPDMGISCSARVHTAASVGGWSFWCSLLYVCLFLAGLNCHHAVMWRRPCHFDVGGPGGAFPSTRSLKAFPAEPAYFDGHVGVVCGMNGTILMFAALCLLPHAAAVIAIMLSCGVVVVISVLVVVLPFHQMKAFPGEPATLTLLRACQLWLRFTVADRGSV